MPSLVCTTRLSRLSPFSSFIPVTQQSLLVSLKKVAQDPHDEVFKVSVISNDRAEGIVREISGQDCMKMTKY